MPHWGVKGKGGPGWASMGQGELEWTTTGRDKILPLPGERAKNYLNFTLKNLSLTS
jgi:hypothetical protein